jgi:TRAP-type C4-dicarboxylate transport system permease small subunit
MIQKMSAWADNLAQKFLFLLISIILILVFLQVIFRYIFSQSIVWSEEVSRYAFVWATFVGASLASRQALHVAVGIVVDHVPSMAKRYLSIIANILVLVFVCVATVVTGQVTLRALNQQTAVLQVPMAIPYAGMCLGCVLLVIQQLSIVSRAIKGEDISWETTMDGTPFPKE